VGCTGVPTAETFGALTISVVSTPKGVGGGSWEFEPYRDYESERRESILRDDEEVMELLAMILPITLD